VVLDIGICDLVRRFSTAAAAAHASRRVGTYISPASPRSGDSSSMPRSGAAIPRAEQRGTVRGAGSGGGGAGCGEGANEKETRSGVGAMNITKHLCSKPHCT
jgi:hypothetical protein